MRDGAVLSYHPSSKGAVVAVAFEDGRTRNLWDTDSQLKEVVATTAKERQRRK